MTSTDFTFDTPHGPVRLEMRDPVSLNPAPRNVMKHSDPEIARLVGSIGAHGFLEVPLYNEQTDRIVAGHARREAAIANHLDAIPVFVGAWDATTEDALTIALQGQQYGEWDDDALAKVLAELQEADYDLDGTGLEPFKIEELLGQESGLLTGADPDDVPDMDAGAEPITQRGDVILLGRHRLMCGDSTSITDVERLMDGEKADMLWTDPPYGVSYVGKTSESLTIQNDGAADLPELLQGAFADAVVALKPGAPFYVAHPPGALHLHFWQAAIACGWQIHEELIWLKDSMVLGHSDYHFKHEPILYGWMPGPGRSGRGNHDGSQWYGDHSQTSVLDIPRPKRSEEHPTMKPPALIEACLANSCPPRGSVLDLFGGSGSTLIAAEQTNRTAYLMELDPRYADVICKRFETLTGKTAVRPERVTP